MASSSDPEDEVIVVDDHSHSDRWGVHCVATWKIENFSSCQLECDEELFSPMLSADSTGKIKWCLSIFPNGHAGHEEYVSIYVVFMESADATMDRFKGSCKVSILDSESNAWMCDRIDQNLPRFQFDAFVRREQLFSAKDAVFPRDVLTIRCQIVIFDPTAAAVEAGNRSGEVEPPAAGHLKVLADDLKKLYERQKFCDVALETRDGNVSAHRAILAARSTGFAELFRESRATYPLPDSDKKTTKALVAYLYSGRMEPTDLAAMPDLYDFARAYDLRELTRVLEPNRISVQTEVTNDVFSYTWRVRNFSRIDAEGRRYSGTFYTGPSSRAWNLSLQCKKIDGDPHLAVYLNKLGGAGDEKAVYVRFKVSLLDAEQQVTHTMEATKLYNPGSRHGFPNFIKRSSPLLQQQKDTLTIHCDMSLCGGASSSRIQHSFHSRGPTGVSDEEALSACLRELLRGERHSDVTVCATDREFRLHKPVLCARSAVFANFFDRYSNGLSNYTINVQGIRAEILELFFSFVYAGALEADLTCRTAPELFAAADHYKISGLKKLCSGFMIANISEIVVRMSQVSDSKLKELVNDFVCLNAEEVLVSDQWSELVRNHPRLASDILKSLARGYQEAKRRRVE